jgi:hypothetical protein
VCYTIIAIIASVLYNSCKCVIQLLQLLQVCYTIIPIISSVLYNYSNYCKCVIQLLQLLQVCYTMIAIIASVLYNNFNYCNNCNYCITHLHTGFPSSSGGRILVGGGRHFPHPSRPAMGPTQPPIQGIPGHSQEQSGRGIPSITNSHLAPTLKKE